MENNQLERRSNQPARRSSPDDDWKSMNAVLARIGLAGEPKSRLPTRRPGRLVIALDLTGSREPSLAQARVATAAMFDAIRDIGAVELQLAYYRGLRECRASKWHNNPGVLCDLMRKLKCEAGETQIARILRMILKEERLSGVVFVGDQCEDDPDQLIGLARALGKRSVPMFVFHEVSDYNALSLKAKPLFKGMAEASGGVYSEFRPDAGAALRELLSTVAAFSAAGAEGVKQVDAATTPAARQLQTRLLLGPAQGQ